MYRNPSHANSTALDEELWFQFVNSLNNPSSNNQSSHYHNQQHDNHYYSEHGLYSAQSDDSSDLAQKSDIVSSKDSNGRSSYTNGSLDNDDASNDPDFTVNNDMDEVDYDDWVQVPSK
jgi:hypothetical protein